MKRKNERQMIIANAITTLIQKRICGTCWAVIEK